MTAGVAIEGIIVAIIPAEAGVTRAVLEIAVKAGDLGTIAAPDKIVAALTVMAAEIVAIALRRTNPLTGQFATAGATLIKIGVVAIGIGTRAKTRIVTRTATAIRTKIRIAERTGIAIKIEIRIKTRIKTRTEIVDATDTIVVIGDTIVTPSTTTRLLTSPLITKTMLMA